MYIIPKPSHLMNSHPKKTGRFGRAAHCKTCDAARSAAYYVAHRDTIKARVRESYDADIGAARARERARKRDPIERRAANARYETTRNGHEVIRALHRKYYRESIEKWMVRSAQVATTKTGAGPGDLIVADILALRIEQGDRCATCDATWPLELDHIIPVSRGGESTRANCQLLCGRCNRRKHNKLSGR